MAVADGEETTKVKREGAGDVNIKEMEAVDTEEAAQLEEVATEPGEEEVEKTEEAAGAPEIGGRGSELRALEEK